VGRGTRIVWCDHTFNPWWGCTRVSKGCEHCYAERLDRRFYAQSPHWGTQERRTWDPRTAVGSRHWHEPVRWNARARKEGTIARVFCGSMCDVFEDNPQVTTSRDLLWDIVEGTMSLEWLLLTKRIENAMRMLPVGLRNVRVGVTVVNQGEADEKIPVLLSLGTATFVSYEPALGPVHMRDEWLGSLGWVIMGAESGPGGREMDEDWVRSMRDQCVAHGVPFLYKQRVVGGKVEELPVLDEEVWDQKPSWAQTKERGCTTG